MKRSSAYRLVWLTVVWATLFSCEKDIPTNLGFESYEFSGMDTDGGDWKPILLENAESIEVNAPEDATSQSYLIEIAELKSAIQSINSEQKRAIISLQCRPLLKF